MCFGGYPRSVCLLCNYLPLRAEPELLLLDERLLLEPEENEPTERLTLLAPLLLLDEKELLERLLDDELLLELLDDEVLRLELRLVTLLSDEELLFDEELVRFTTVTFLLPLDEVLLEALALDELLLLFLTADEPREVELLTLLPPTATAPPRDEELLLPFTMVAPPPRITSLDTLLGLLGVAELPLATISFLALEALCSSKR